ncbi:L,D-transpeptidase [Microbacterium sp.]|uniref:L,D-transpeptidase n=1 Tax=Microbacterium sp. TaxID=51671 RepID=UPI00261C4A6B|nr:L,D-transpeptidase [Microbacterium sp.]
MTDLIEAPGAATAQTTTVTEALPPNDGERPLQWAPNEPQPKKHRVGLWVGLGVGALVLAAGAASTILIAPGTTIAGIPVGGLTPGAAAEVVNSRLADIEVSLTDVNGDPVVTGADLGASIDATTLADEAFASHPMWNVTTWMPEPIAGEITLDPEAAPSALRALVPASYEDPVNASVVFDTASSAYVATPAATGTGIDLDGLTAAISSAIADGDSGVSFSGAPTETTPAVTDETAASTAETMNSMLGQIGFYVGDERTVAIKPEVAATWLEVVPDDGELHVVADETEIQAVVDTLPGLVNRDAVDARAVVNSNGEVLRELNAGASGRELGDISNAASDFAAQLENGNAVYELDVSETAFETATVVRRIDLNLSTQRATAYENDQVVNSWAISSGLPGTPTPTGNFSVFGHTAMQDMGCFEGAPYCTENVPWSTWFAPNIAFHGTYWHSNFGSQMSHGCVNMPISAAKYIYEWAPVGTAVSVHW